MATRIHKSSRRTLRPSLPSGGITRGSAALHDGERIEVIGRSYDLGSIQPGKLADLVIMDKNPRDDVHNTSTIHWVMKNGELFEGDTLNQVWPEQKKLEPLYFRNYDAPKITAPLSYRKTVTP